MNMGFGVVALSKRCPPDKVYRVPIFPRRIITLNHVSDRLVQSQTSHLYIYIPPIHACTFIAINKKPPGPVTTCQAEKTRLFFHFRRKGLKVSRSMQKVAKSQARFPRTTEVCNCAVFFSPCRRPMQVPDYVRMCGDGGDNRPLCLRQLSSFPCQTTLSSPHFLLSSPTPASSPVFLRELWDLARYPAYKVDSAAIKAA